jgi:hypothetical protein
MRTYSVWGDGCIFTVVVRMGTLRGTHAHPHACTDARGAPLCPDLLPLVPDHGCRRARLLSEEACLQQQVARERLVWREMGGRGRPSRAPRAGRGTRLRRAACVDRPDMGAPSSGTRGLPGRRAAGWGGAWGHKGGSVHAALIPRPRLGAGRQPARRKPGILRRVAPDSAGVLSWWAYGCVCVCVCVCVWMRGCAVAV